MRICKCGHTRDQHFHHEMTTHCLVTGCKCNNYQEKRKKPVAAFTILGLAVLACGMQPVPQAGNIRLNDRIFPVLAAAPIPINAELAQVCNSGGLWVRVAAGIENDEVYSLNDGDIVTLNTEDIDTVTEDMSIWKSIRTDAGDGWVNARYLCEVTK